MKTRIWIPALLLAFGLSSFSRSAQVPENNNNEPVTTVMEYCSIYGIGSLTKNGQPVPVDPTQHLFYFCSENNFSLYTHNYVANGTWVDYGKAILISVSVTDPAMAWVDGNWTVLERSEWTLEMEHLYNGDVWRVRLEGRQR
jgi:hypothetical protein